MNREMRPQPTRTSPLTGGMSSFRPRPPTSSKTTAKRSRKEKRPNRPARCAKAASSATTAPLGSCGSWRAAIWSSVKVRKRASCSFVAPRTHRSAKKDAMSPSPPLNNWCRTPNRRRPKTSRCMSATWKMHQGRPAPTPSSRPRTAANSRLFTTTLSSPRPFREAIQAQKCGRIARSVPMGATYCSGRLNCRRTSRKARRPIRRRTSCSCATFRIRRRRLSRPSPKVGDPPAAPTGRRASAPTAQPSRGWASTRPRRRYFRGVRSPKKHRVPITCGGVGRNPKSRPGASRGSQTPKTQNATRRKKSILIPRPPAAPATGRSPTPRQAARASAE